MSASTTASHTSGIVVTEAVNRGVQNYCGPKVGRYGLADELRQAGHWRECYEDAWRGVNRRCLSRRGSLRRWLRGTRESRLRQRRSCDQRLLAEITASPSSRKKRREQQRVHM